MEKEIEGVVESFFDIGVVEKGVVYDLHFARNVLHYLIVPPSIGISKCKVALEHESSPFCDEGGIIYLRRRSGIHQQRLRLFSFVSVGLFVPTGMVILYGVFPLTLGI